MTDGLTITIVTPAQAASRAGNRITAERWQSVLHGLGHRVNIVTSYAGEPADILVAIHAWRSAAAVARFKSACPGRPVVVCLSGTDIYSFQASHPGETLGSMEAADVLVGLHDLVGHSIPERFRAKLRIIHQSAPMLPRKPAAPDAFDICVIGHLRAEKDPFRTAAASRLLPASSRVRITHVGRALDESWAGSARDEMAANPRYHWRGEVSGEAVRDILATTRLMVLSSVMEGGANVLGEALAAGVPVLASAIDGSLGLLGLDYPGTFPVRGTAALAHLLTRAESEPEFLALLAELCAARAPMFSLARERDSWRELINDLTRTRGH